MSEPTLKSLQQPVHFLALGFGSGLAPKAPGTFGTLAAIPLYYLMSGLSWQIYMGIVVVAAIAGLWICGESAQRLHVHDHPAIVWDEIVGYLITMFMLPVSWQWMVAGFVLFRFFDILKPWPISWLDSQLKGGLGIMADDILAGLFALLILHTALIWLV
jgi:phosphatidylglycerophosphatase A